MAETRILLIGYGAIASDVLDALPLVNDQCELGVLHRQKPKKNLSASFKHFSTIDAVRDWQPDLVIEAAGHEAVRSSVPVFLEYGIPVLVSSVGALHDIELFQKLIDEAEQGKTKLLLPSGAIGALDYVRAFRFTKEYKIVYESRKPLAAWQKELETLGYDLSSIKNPIVLFDGVAREAARLYPANLNVAATLALAGIGMDETKVRVIADPALKGNQHHIHAQSDHGEMHVRFENTVSLANPKSSRIVAKSIVAAVQQYFSPYQFL